MWVSLKKLILDLPWLGNNILATPSTLKNISWVIGSVDREGSSNVQKYLPLAWREWTWKFGRRGNEWEGTKSVPLFEEECGTRPNHRSFFIALTASTNIHHLFSPTPLIRHTTLAEAQSRKSVSCISQSISLQDVYAFYWWELSTSDGRLQTHISQISEFCLYTKRRETRGSSINLKF